MTPARANKLLQRFYRDTRLSWLRAIRLVRSDFTNADVAAEKFASSVVKYAIQAGYAEDDYLRTNVFDPALSSANGLRAMKQTIMNRFLRDVQSSTTAGLGARQREELSTYRQVLQGSLNDSLDRGERVTLKPKEIEAQVKNFENRLIELRARTIARDYSSEAHNLGVTIAHQQAQALGLIPNQKRKWLTSGDEKVRSSHSAMNGQVRGLLEPFISGNGYALMRPHDPNAPASETANCRCLVITERT